MLHRVRAPLVVAVAVLATIVFPEALRAQGDAAATSRRFHTDRATARVLPLPKEEGVFHFAIFGDRTGGPREGVKVLAQAVEDVNLLAPDLVMTVGDLVEGYTDETNWKTQADEYVSIMRRLKMPWFPVAGNHDVYYRGSKKDRLGNEDLFETHFGPLWYSFEHKSCRFVVLYSDEGDLETGVKNFRSPKSHVMSPAQFAFLEETLGRSKSADHVFVFLHHPRWLGNRDDRADYGSDWDRVHALLKSAGNVSAVFAGHIHRMRYDGRRDGIEYFALAATGGSISTDVPKAGFLHHYLIVTVRKDRVDAASLPVGAVFDPRAADPAVSDDVLALTRRLNLRRTAHGTMGRDGALDATIEIAFDNPASRPVELTLTPILDDPTFEAVPDHVHKTAAAGESATVAFRLLRDARPIDPWFRWPTMDVVVELKTETARIALPPRSLTVPIRAPYELFCSKDAPNRALKLDGRADHATVDASRLRVFQSGAFTLEGRLKAASLKGRRGFLCNTEQSGYGIFVSDGTPSFVVHVGGAYVAATGPKASLPEGVWRHVAGVFDGAEARLYVDGVLVASQKGSGAPKENRLPFMIGADVDAKGEATSFFEGLVDEIRVSKTARYLGPKVEIPARHVDDDDTLLLLRCDGGRGGVLPDFSRKGVHAALVGSATFVDPDSP
jgi:UDP-2,3-diacylglucosamine pyrophosphatase LpxH